MLDVAVSESEENVMHDQKESTVEVGVDDGIELARMVLERAVQREVTQGVENLDVQIEDLAWKIWHAARVSGQVQESLATARLRIDDILRSVDCGALNIEVKNLRNMVVVLIKGEPGSGKTSFAREMRKRLEQDGDLSIAWWSSPRGYNDIEDVIFLDDYPDSLELIKSMDSAGRFSDGRFNRYTTSPKSPLIMVATVNV